MRRQLAMRSRLIVQRPTQDPDVVTGGGIALPRSIFDAGLTLALLAAAALAWWATLRMSADMDMMMFEPVPFLVGWAAMMAAMMLPAVTPVSRLYARASRLGRVAPADFFASG